MLHPNSQRCGCECVGEAERRQEDKEGKGVLAWVFFLPFCHEKFSHIYTLQVCVPWPAPIHFGNDAASQPSHVGSNTTILKSGGESVYRLQPPPCQDQLLRCTNHSNPCCKSDSKSMQDVRFWVQLGRRWRVGQRPRQTHREGEDEEQVSWLDVMGAVSSSYAAPAAPNENPWKWGRQQNLTDQCTKYSLLCLVCERRHTWQEKVMLLTYSIYVTNDIKAMFSWIPTVKRHCKGFLMVVE